MQRIVELERFICAAHLRGQLVQTHQRPAVDILQRIGRHRILVRVEPMQVAQDKARGVADFAVGFGQLFQNILRQAHIHAIIQRCHPQAQNIRAVLVDNLAGGNDIAQRLGHFAALAVHRPAVGQHALVRRFAAPRHSGQQRRLEPSAILVATLHIQIRRPGQIVAVVQHRRVRAAGIEPHIHDVAFFAEPPQCGQVAPSGKISAAS